MKIVALSAFVAGGALTAALALGAAPIGGNILGGGIGLTLTGAGMIAFGMAMRRHRQAVRAESEPALIPELAPLPRFFAEERARMGGEVIAFGRKLPGQDAPDLPPMLEAELNRQMLRRAERVCATARDE